MALTWLRRVLTLSPDRTRPPATFPSRPGQPVNRLRPLATLLALVAGAPLVQAQYLGSPFSYNYVELDYMSTDFDLASEFIDGYGAQISIESNKNIRVMGRWGDMLGTVSGQDALRRDIEVGIGFHQTINRQLDSLLDIKYVRSEREARGTRSSDAGFGIELGLRGLLTDTFEVNGSIEYRDLVQSEVGLRLGVLTHFNRHVGLEVGYVYFGEQQTLHAGVRFSL